MEFILPFHIEPSRHKISHDQKILFIGSCFTEEIGNHFKNLKFDVLQNPNGILYDPRSITYALNSYIENKQYHEEDLFFQNELWHSWEHHSRWSGIKKKEVLDKIDRSQSAANIFLQKASWLIITPGTSYSYKLKNNESFVANCHKFPGSFFSKKLISVEEIHSQLLRTVQRLQDFNPELKIIFTISPVRHVKDGIVENNRSKSRLIEAVHSIAEQYNHVFYFPAYELVIDVLRDYRFYKVDMVHANEIAVNYVFETFCDAYLDEPAKELVEELKALLNAMNHKPFHKEGDAHKKFLKTHLEKTQKIIEANPGINLINELNYFSGSG